MPSSSAKSVLVIWAAMLIASATAKSPEEFLGSSDKKPPVSAKPAASPSVSGAPASGPAVPKTGASAQAKETGAPKPSAQRAAMDTAKIHAVYLEGDFDLAIRTLEGVLKSKKPLTHADSVFIFKHLGVMYAASPATRDKGRYYILQLIDIEPTAKILDMYASDTIYLIFRNAQEELESKRRAAAKATALDTAPVPQPARTAAPSEAPAASAPPKSQTKYWVAGGAVLALGTASILYILLDEPEPTKHNIVLKD